MENVYYLRITNTCNQNCIYCNVRNSESERIYSNEELISRIPLGIDRLIITGGEPFLEKSLPLFIHYASSKNIKVDIQTNGTLLSSKRADKWFNSLPINKLIVSLNACNNDDNRELTRSDYFDYVIKGVQHALSKGLSIKLVHLITQKTYSKLQDWVELVYQNFGHQCELQFTTLIPKGNAVNHPELFAKYSKIIPHLIKAIDYCKTHNLSVSIAGDYGIPICFIPPSHLQFSETYHHLNSNPHNERSYDLFTYVKACDLCFYRNICSGIWKYYLNQYGETEFKPRIFRFQALPKITAEVLPLTIKPYRDLMEKRESLISEEGDWFIWQVDPSSNPSSVLRELELLNQLKSLGFKKLLLKLTTPELIKQVNLLNSVSFDSRITLSIQTKFSRDNLEAIKHINPISLNELIITMDDESINNENFELLFSFLDAFDHDTNNINAIILQLDLSVKFSSPDKLQSFFEKVVNNKIHLILINIQPSMWEGEDKENRIQQNVFKVLPVIVQTLLDKKLRFNIIPSSIDQYWFFKYYGADFTENYSLGIIKEEDYINYLNGYYNYEFNKKFHCLSSWFDKYMDGQGNIFPCSQERAVKSEYCVGNIKNKTLSEIINSEPMISFRKNVPFHSCCQQCFAISSISESKIKHLPKYNRIIDNKEYFTFPVDNPT